ncbi:MAG: FAD-binding oxidoreductase [Bacteroidales bacterium]|nr:FAD-binding oxidoreductase [Bacteroidales bacterium]
MLKQFDQLVVGGGLAGSLMAYRLWKAGQKVCWIKTSSEGSSTDVAAGLINPLVFRYLTPVWRVETLLPQAVSFYRQLEAECSQQFLHEITVAKLFGDQDQALWQQKMKLPKVSRWVESIGAVADAPHLIQPWGAGFVNGYWLDTSLFLKAVEQLLSQHLNIIEGNFNASKLELTEEGVI